MIRLGRMGASLESPGPGAGSVEAEAEVGRTPPGLGVTIPGPLIVLLIPVTWVVAAVVAPLEMLAGVGDMSRRLLLERFDPSRLRPAVRLGLLSPPVIPPALATPLTVPTPPTPPIAPAAMLPTPPDTGTPPPSNLLGPFPTRPTAPGEGSGVPPRMGGYLPCLAAC